MNKKLTWRTTKIKVDDLIPFDENPRILSEKQLKDLKTSLKKFNLVEIPVMDLDKQIIAGHQRIKVLQLLGRGQEKIEARVPSRKLTQKEYEQYLLTSNAVKGDWDYDLLKSFDIELLLAVGFDDGDLSAIWDENLEIEDDNFNEEIELEKAKKTDIKSGDLFQLGDHFLICGNSHQKETLDKLMKDKKADMIYNDPIYNIGIDYNRGIGGKANYGGTVNDKKTDEEYKEFLKQGLENSLSHANKNCHVFTWCDQKYIWLLQTLYKEIGIDNKRVCMWIKNGFNPTPKIAFNKGMEPCVYGIRNKPYLSPIKNLNEILNKEIGTGNRGIDDILDILDIWLVKRLAGQDYEHSTQKPPTLHEKALRRCTRPGDTVLDIYAGTGSTMIACEQLKRRCYLSELEPVFSQLIINRYKNYANKKVRKLN